MRWWLILSIFGYATKAVPTIIDKALFHTKAVKHPGTYAVAVSAIGGLVLLLAPFFLTWPTWHIVIYALVSGAAFTLATLFFPLQPSVRFHADKNIINYFLQVVKSLCFTLRLTTGTN